MNGKTLSIKLVIRFITVPYRNGMLIMTRAVPDSVQFMGNFSIGVDLGGTSHRAAAHGTP